MSKAAGQLVRAFSTTPADQPFSCPECGLVAVLRTGRLRAHHFAHRARAACPYGETVEHLLAKKAVYETFKAHPLMASVELEAKIGDRRPDVQAVRSPEQAGEPYAIAVELQKSKIKPDLFWQRTRELSEQNVAVVWVKMNPAWMRQVQEGATLFEDGIGGLGDSIRAHQGCLYLWAGEADLVHPLVVRPLYRYNEHYGNWSRNPLKTKFSLHVLSAVPLSDLWLSSQGSTRAYGRVKYGQSQIFNAWVDVPGYDAASFLDRAALLEQHFPSVDETPEETLVIG